MNESSDIIHLSCFIACPPVEVYDFARDPRNLPRWAKGLAQSSVRRDTRVGEEEDAWIVDAPFGRARIRFAPRNPFGVLDHDVVMEDSGAVFHNPMRVIARGEGSEFIFTLMRQPGMSDAELGRDRVAVETDLLTLKQLLEQP
jgi:hypothetical protein